MKYTIPIELKEMFNSLIKLYDIAYKEIKPKVIYIIKNNIKDTNLIEHTLDDLLNISTNDCYILFVYLCKYVETFNKEIAIDYLNIYEELYGPENTKIKKKTIIDK